MAKTMETNEAGMLLCPNCGAAMVGMRGSMTGKGFNCSRQEYDRQTRSVKGCDGVRWTASRFVRKAAATRPDCWPIIKRRTAEQEQCRADLMTAPAARKPRARCIIWNAGPGTGKSTTVADGCEGVYQRVGSCLSDWWLVAFGVNSADSLREKIPQNGPNIGTINGFGGRLQGYQSRQYKTNKLRTLFASLVDHLPRKERPQFGPLKAFAERGRDQLAFPIGSNDRAEWNAAIDAIAGRFPSLAKKLESEATEETVREYLPELVRLALAHRSEICLNEQYTRPVTLTQDREAFALPLRLVERGAEWTPEDIATLAGFIRRMDLPQLRGVFVDEAQDLSLAQICLFLAVTWRGGELVAVGDDKRGTPGDADYKAGQGIFAWRGAFSGSLALLAQLWEALTGERPISRDLSVTFRCPPEHCEAFRSLNATLTSAKPAGSGEVAIIGATLAFERWLSIDEATETALWLTRRNAPLASVFLATVKARKRVCLRGGGDFSGAFDSLMYEAAGYYNDAGEYRVSLADALAKIREIQANDADDDDAGATTNNGDDFGAFVLTLAEEILADPSILTEAKNAEGVTLEAVATVGNLRRFVLYFVDTKAPRVCSTVYRAKGDEATVVVVDDCEAMNAAWNGDEDESAAVRLVALSRSKRSLWLTGPVAGCCCDMTASAAPAPMPAAFAAIKATPAPVKPSKPSKADAPPAVTFTDEAARAKWEAPATVQPVKATPSKADAPALDADALADAARAAVARKDMAEARRLAEAYLALTGRRVPMKK